MEIILLILAGLIALAGLNTSYRHIGIILFVEFSIMTGYQEIITDPDYFIWASTEQLSVFYGIKAAIQTVFFMTYMALNSRALSIMSGVIIGYLFITGCLSLYGLDNVYYESNMTALSVIQLVIGLIGVLNGYRYILGSPWHYFSSSGHKGA